MFGQSPVHQIRHLLSKNVFANFIFDWQKMRYFAFKQFSFCENQVVRNITGYNVQQNWSQFKASTTPTSSPKPFIINTTLLIFFCIMHFTLLLPRYVVNCALLLSYSYYIIFYAVQFYYCCPDINGLVQERRNSSALAMGLRLSCTNPSISGAMHNTFTLLTHWDRVMHICISKQSLVQIMDYHLASAEPLSETMVEYC